MEDPQPAHISPLEPAFDVTAALARVDGDRELLAELVQIVRAESPRVLSEIRRCVDAGDPAGLERAAHRLRGSIGVFGARSVLQAALELETMARNQMLMDAAPKLAELQKALDQFDGDLAALSEDSFL